MYSDAAIQRHELIGLAPFVSDGCLEVQQCTRELVVVLFSLFDSHEHAQSSRKSLSRRRPNKVEADNLVIDSCHSHVYELTIHKIQAHIYNSIRRLSQSKICTTQVSMLVQIASVSHRS